MSFAKNCIGETPRSTFSNIAQITRFARIPNLVQVALQRYNPILLHKSRKKFVATVDIITCVSSRSKYWHRAVSLNYEATKCCIVEFQEFSAISRCLLSLCNLLYLCSWPLNSIQGEGSSMQTTFLRSPK